MAPRSKVGSVLLGIGIGLGVAVAAMAVVFAIVAVPIFFLSGEGDAVDAGMVRMGLFAIALPAGVLIGLAVGITVGVWHSRGGQLPTGRDAIHG